MNNLFAGVLIMAGIAACLALSAWLGIVERREDKHLEKAAEQEAEFQHKRIEAAQKHQEEQMRLRCEDWRDAV